MKNTKSLSYTTESMNVIPVAEWNRFVKDTYGRDYDYMKDHEGSKTNQFFVSGNKPASANSKVVSMWVEGYVSKSISFLLLEDLCYRNIITPGKYLIRS